MRGDYDRRRKRAHNLMPATLYGLGGMEGGSAAPTLGLSWR